MGTSPRLAGMLPGAGRRLTSGTPSVAVPGAGPCVRKACTPSRPRGAAYACEARITRFARVAPYRTFTAVS